MVITGVQAEWKWWSATYNGRPSTSHFVFVDAVIVHNAYMLKKEIKFRNKIEKKNKI